VGGSDALDAWRAALFSDAHGLPVLAIRDGRVRALNLPARSLAGNLDVGAPVDALLDERGRAKMRAFLAQGVSGSTVELQLFRTDRPPTTVTFLLLDAPGEQLLLGRPSERYTDAMAAELMATNAHLANVTRELAKAKDTEHRLRADLEALARASSAVAETVAEMPQADLSAVLLMIAMQARSLTRADYAALGIGDDRERPFHHWVFLGVSREVARAIGRPAQPAGVLGRVACDNAVVRTADIRREPDFAGLPAGHPRIASFLGVPIRHRGNSVGNIYLANRPGGREFSEQDERLVRMLATRVGAAIETASVYVTTNLQRAWLQNVIDQMPDGVLLYDRDGRLKAMNQGVAPFSSAESELLIDFRRADGQPLREERRPLYRALVDHEVVREELLVRRQSGELTPVAVSAGPVRDTKGEVSGAMVIVQDIADRKELERLREEWAAVVAHDLRQPVNTISLATESLLRTNGELPDEARRTLERIGSASRRLSRMITDLLDISRIESNRMIVDCRPVGLGSFIESVVDALHDTLAGHRVHVLVAPEHVVWIDPDRIHQVLGNLISNAVKYGSPDTDVEIEAAPDDDWVEITVTNHGPGIAADQLPFLFSRFTRIRGARESGTASVGLGLYIARGLVEAHGGRLWVQSTPGDTTSFHFTLPKPPRLPLPRDEGAWHAPP
jgi:PAS domain S-box-containing protein